MGHRARALRVAENWASQDAHLRMALVMAPPQGAVPSSPNSKGKEDSELVLSTLADAANDREAALEGLRVLEAATFKGSGQSRVLSGDGVKGVTLVMTEHLTDAEVQVMACRVLQHLAAASSDGGLALAQAGACAAVRAAMDAHSGDPLVQQAACHATEVLAFGSPEVRSQAVSDGTGQAVMNAIKRHRANAFVQQAALPALHAMAEDGEQLLEQVKKAGTIAAIVAALSDHKDDPQVQNWGQLALRGLCSQSDELRTEALRKCHWQGLELDLS